MHHIFVYGSLKRGGLNQHAMGRVATGFRGPGSTVSDAFRMASLVWFPAVISVPDGGTHISGEVYETDDHGLQVLDTIEGELYTRTEVDVRLDTGVVLRAWMYVLDDDLLLEEGVRQPTLGFLVAHDPTTNTAAWVAG